MPSKPKLNLKALRKQLEEPQAELLESTLSTSDDRAPVELDQAMQGGSVQNLSHICLGWWSDPVRRSSFFP